MDARDPSITNASATWFLALHRAIGRAESCLDETSIERERAAEEIRRALVQAKRRLRAAECAAHDALARLALHADGADNHGRHEGALVERDAIELRACEWVGAWLWKARTPWSGPSEILMRTRRLVIALRPGEPIEFLPSPRERFVLRIAPAETPPVKLLSEPDTGAAHDVIYLPPSIRDGVESEPPA